jgi:soluble lytic murein transglycosylase-like protein
MIGENFIKAKLPPITQHEESTDKPIMSRKAFWIVLLLCGTAWFFLFTMIGHTQEIDLKSISIIESHGNPLAYNWKTGARGEYQLMPCVYKEYGRQGQDKDIANWYLKVFLVKCLKTYNIPVSNLNLIASYNWGIGHVKKWYRKGGKFESLPKETREYYKKYVSLCKLRKRV